MAGMTKRKYVYKDQEDLLRKVGKTLVGKHLQMGTAESCTGGRIASMVTSIPASSDHFVGGIVSYSNDVKRNVLGVKEDDLKLFGAVSQPVVEQMALGAVSVLGCNCTVATSGIAGPDGGTPDKPVGTVWIAAAWDDRVNAVLYHFEGDRQQIIQQSAETALKMLLELIQNK